MDLHEAFYFFAFVVVVVAMCVGMILSGVGD